MPRPAKTRIAGTLIATALSVLWCGAATSQTAPPSTVVNDQVQLGDVFATQTLDVVDPSDVVVAATTALGNTAGISVDGVQVEVQSRQRLKGDVRGYTEANLNSSAAGGVALTTTAVGNSGESDAISGGVVIGAYQQKARTDLVRAGTRVNGENAQAGDLSAASNAVVNSQGFGADAGHVEGTVRQTSRAAVEAATGGNLRYTPGTVSFASTAVANNITGSGVNGSAMLIDSTQRMAGDHAQATAFLSVGNVQSLSNAAVATANNLSSNNQGGPLEVRTDQVNKAYVRAQAVSAADQFGSAVTVAYGVGNSVLAGEFGSELTLDNRQFNAGADIDAIASSTGREGYDMTASSTAMGNAVTGYACTECGGVMNVGNSQTNRSNVTSTTTVGVSGSNRSVSGTSTAVGNTATFYVSRPGT